MLMHLLWNFSHKVEELGFRGSSRFRKFVQKNFFEDRYIRTPYLDHHIYVCPTHIMGRTVFEGNIYEPEIIKIIRAFIQNEFSFIDIGANIGLHTLAAAFERKNDSQVFISFEPEIEMFLILKKNCMENNLNFVTCRQEGVGDKDSYLTLNVSTTHNKGHNSFLPIEGSKIGQAIKISTLDTLFLNAEEMCANPILVKVDAEGYELPIIKGAAQWLFKIKNAAVICEVWPELMEKNKMTVSDLFQTLHECGLTKHKMIESETGNAIFYKGDFSEKVISQLMPE